MPTPRSTHSDDLPGLLNVRKMRSNQWLEYALDKQSPWVQKLLVELNENAPDGTAEENLENSRLNLNIQLKKCNSDLVGDYVLGHVEVEAIFNTQCVKTSVPMKDSLNFSFKLCFLPFEQSNKEEYQDQTEYFTDGELFDLYFLNAKNEAPILEACHEQIFLHLDYYPTVEKES